MKQTFLIVLALCLCAFPSTAVERPPNVILIYSDDQGSVDMNVYGAADLHTPHMDALARSGVRFTRFYTASPVCSPSRAALLTGRYPQRAQLATNASSQRGDPGGMPGSQVTLAEMLKSAGYVTGHIGKWHLGYQPDMMPSAQGFDHSFGHMGGCIDNFSHFFYWQGPNRHDLWRNNEEVFHDGRYFPDLMVEEAAAFMQEHRERPFFIYYALNTPHYPYQGHAKWLEHYKDLPYPRNLYAAFLSTQDEYIGQLLAKVDELGLREETIVVFQSDHGHSTEERAHFGGGSAGPYRGAKFSVFEGGIRVPAIISWPGRIAANEMRGQFATSVDWVPTILELCSASLPDVKIDGRSLVPIIESPQAPGAHDVFHWQLGNQWAARRGEWKLIVNGFDNGQGHPGPRLDEADRTFLVNLDADPAEARNLAAEHPDLVDELRALHEQWASSVGQQ